MASDICSTCGAPLDSARYDGRCEVCLFADAFALRVEDGTLGEIDGHELIEEIARGGMGVVYRARQREPEREVALKTMRGAELDSPAALARFEHEARAMAGLDHPAILPVFTFGEQDGVPFFTMKLATGGTLAQRLGRYAGKWREIAELVATIADAVQHAHTHAVLHRDLKPGNILFDESGHAFVSDFGIAKLLDSTDGALTRTAAVLGTPHYLAPEIAAHDARAATTASDVWSLGVILYELLAQRRPFDGDSIPALLRAITDTEPVGLPDVPRDLAVITRKALAREPAGRYASASDFAEDLRRWLAGQAITARPVSALERLRLWARRNPLVAALSALLALAVLVGGGLLVRAYHRTQEALRDALIIQARFERASGQVGERLSALATLQRAAAIRMDTGIVSECAAALAQPDVSARPAWKFAEVDGNEIAEFSPALDRCAVPERAGGFTLRTAAEGKVLRRCTAPLPAITFAFAADGASLAAKLSNDLVQIWPAQGDAPVAEIPGSAVFGLKSGIPAAFSSALAAWAVVGRDGAVLKVSPTGEQSVWLPASGRVAGSLKFDPRGERLVAAFRDGLELWAMSGQPRLLWSRPQQNTLAALAWHPSGLFLATTAQTGIREVTVLDAASGTERVRLRGPMQSIGGLAFHPTRDLLAAVSNDTSLRLWDYRDGRQVLMIPGAGRTVAWSPDGRRLGCEIGLEAIGVFDFADDAVLREFGAHYVFGQGTTNDFTASPDRRWLLANANGLVELWNTETRKLAGEIHRATLGADPAFLTPDGRWLVSTDDSGRAGLCRWPLQRDAATGATSLGPMEALPGTTGLHLREVAGDGTWLVYRGPTRTWESWPGGAATHATTLLRDASFAVRFSPDLRWALVPRGKAHLDLVDRRAPASPHPIELAGAGFARFSPDSRWAFVRGTDENLLLETGTSREVARWGTGGYRYGVGCTAFSADSKRLALSVNNESIQILSVPELRLLVSLTPPRALDFRRLVFSADGGKLWALGVAGRIFEWDLGGLQTELQRLGLSWAR